MPLTPASPTCLPADRSWLGRQIDRCFSCRSTVKLTSDPNEAAGAAGGSPLPPLPSGGGGGATPMARQVSKKPSASTEAGTAGGFLYTNDSMLLSQEMSGMSQLAVPQNPRLSNNSTVGETSAGAEEARDHFVVDGLSTLSDWEIRPEGEPEGRLSVCVAGAGVSLHGGGSGRGVSAGWWAAAEAGSRLDR